MAFNRTFCLNFFEPVLNETSNLLYCPCTSNYKGDYCQVNLTLAPVIITSAALSLVACLVQFYFRLRYRWQFSQWPNYIVYFRSVTDFMFSLHLMIFQGIIIKDANILNCNVAPRDQSAVLDPSCSSGQIRPCTYFSFVFQFTLVGSLLWFGCGSYDYWKTISDPFVHPSTYKGIYTFGVLLVSLGLAIAGILAAPNGSSDRLYRDGMQACWTSTTTGVNETNLYTMYIWLFLSLSVTVVVGAVGYIKMRAGGTTNTLTKRLHAIAASRAQLLAFAAFWSIWGTLFALYYFGGEWLKLGNRAFEWTSYPMMGLLPLNGFVNAVVWLRNNRQEIKQAIAADKENRLLLRTRGLAEAAERESARQEEEKSDMSQALKDELLQKIASGMTEVLSPPSDHKFEGPQPIPNLIFDGRRVRRQLWPGGESRIPKCCRCPAVDQAREVEFIAHRPNAFQYLRESCYGVTDAEYLKSFESLSAKLLSGGKSGALFFSTPDNKYLVKTLEQGTLFKSSELAVLLGVTDSYCLHMTPRIFRRQSLYKGQFIGCSSLITKIFGCYTIRLYGQTLHFYVMEKLDPESEKVKVTERYDLKGSWVARYSKKAGTGKDQNFNGQTINLAPSLAQEIFMQSVSDVHFFEKNSIMDYSLLLAVHRCQDARIKDQHCTFGKLQGPDGDVKYHVEHAEVKLQKQSSREVVPGGQDVDGHMELDVFRSPTNVVPVHKTFEGGMQSAFIEGPGIYFMGIIDPLQRWDCAKICESYFKRYLMFKGIGISAVPPTLFATRFLLMMLKNLNVSLSSLASLDPAYREAYNIDRVEIVNHKFEPEKKETMYLLHLLRLPEEVDLERVPSSSVSRKSMEIVSRVASPSSGSLVACEAWEAESTMILNPVGKQMVHDYRQNNQLGDIGEPPRNAGPWSFQTTPIGKVVGALGESVGAVARLASSINVRASATSVPDDDEGRNNSVPGTPKGYVPPNVTPLSPSSKSLEISETP